MSSCHNNYDLIRTFSIWKRILYTIGYFSIPIIGLIAIYPYSIAWFTVYLVFLLIGNLYLFGFCLCARCPYYGTSCMMSFGKPIAKIYKFRPGPMSPIDKICALLMPIGMFGIPLYWLIKEPVVLAIFLVIGMLWGSCVMFMECKRCKHFSCPNNKVKKEVKKTVLQQECPECEDKTCAFNI